MQSIELKTRQENLRSLLDEMQELSQGRSNFVLRHFVVGQHDLTGRQRQQVIVELQGMMFELANQADEINLAELEIRELQVALLDSKNTDIDIERLKIKIAQRERQIEQINIRLTGQLRECDTLYAMLQELPKYTKEQFEAEEEAYWGVRLPRQFALSQRDVGGNLTAILEMLTEPGKAKPSVAISIDQLVAIMGLSEESTKKLTGGKQ
jgi:small-conductance mechanosensitive channel